MSLWERVERELNDGVEVVRRRLTEVLDLTEDLTRRGKTKLEIQNCRGAIRDRMAELGGRVYELAVEEKGGDVLADRLVVSIVAKIEELKNKIDAYEEELRKPDQR